jgi:hypothetical protein
MTKPPSERPNAMVDQATAAMFLGVDVTTLIRWGKEDNPPPRDAISKKYPVRELGEWTRKVQITRSNHGRPSDTSVSYPFAPPGWGPLTMPMPVKIETGADDDYVGRHPFDKAAAEVRLKTAQAIKVERENEVEAKRLVYVEDVESAWLVILERVRRRLLQLPSATAMLVMGDSDLYSVQGKLERAVRKALTDLSENWRAGTGDIEGENDDV